MRVAKQLLDVGTAYSRSRVSGEALHWAGHRWKAAPAARNAGNSYSAIACPAFNDCWAVGENDHARDAVVHWNGKAWSSSKVPQPPGGSDVDY